MKKQTKNFRQTAIAMVGGITAFIALTTGAYAQVSTAPQAKIYGQTYGEWSKDWWQWLRSIPDIPPGANPLTASGDVDCSIGQLGSVWFLAGTAEGAATRNCSIPAGKALFFPLVTAMWFDVPPEDFDEFEVRQILDSAFSGADGPFGPLSVACNLDSSVDEVATIFSQPIVRTQSPTFFIEILEGDPIDSDVAGVVDDEAISDGLWVMLPPLSEGDHVLHFKGARCDPRSGRSLFSVEVTYNLTIP